MDPPTPQPKFQRITDECEICGAKLGNAAKHREWHRRIGNAVNTTVDL